MGEKPNGKFFSFAADGLFFRLLVVEPEDEIDTFAFCLCCCWLFVPTAFSLYSFAAGEAGRHRSIQRNIKEGAVERAKK